MQSRAPGHLRRAIYHLPLLVLLFPAPAAADLTAFIGVNPTPERRTVAGFAGGAGLLIVGFEVEYANTTEDDLLDAPGLRTFMVNGLLQTLPIGRFQFYGTAGAGGYRETLRELSETHVGINVGGGAKITLIGPIRLRLDYRVFTLQGEPRHANPHRFYAGFNLKF
jgi:opacity protein-like surface antigen